MYVTKSGFPQPPPRRFCQCTPVFESDLAKQGHHSAHPVAVVLPSHHRCTSISQTKAELLHKQNAQIKELRRKHEAAQLAMAGAAGGEGDQEMQAEEGKEGGRGNEADDDDKGGFVAALRKVCSLTHAWRACCSGQPNWSLHAVNDPQKTVLTLLSSPNK